MILGFGITYVRSSGDIKAKMTHAFRSLDGTPIALLAVSISGKCRLAASVIRVVGSCVILGRPLAPEPDSNANTELAKAWIEASAKYMDEDLHKLKSLPKRMIDIGHNWSPTVYLKDFSKVPSHSSTHKGIYVCLSHCWDSVSSLQTTITATLAARECGIELSTLPQTFRDAIKITRSTGLKYIWIDTLCILQDSKEDWAEESAKMGTYYGSSWLTIGAGVDSMQRLFNKRELNLE